MADKTKISELERAIKNKSEELKKVQAEKKESRRRLSRPCSCRKAGKTYNRADKGT